MECSDNYEKIKKRIEEQKKCMPKCVYCLGATGPQGIQGPTGPQGLPGATGPAGVADTISIGTVATGEPGTNASIIDVGEAPNHILNFVIPRGFDGDSSNTNDFCCFCVQQMRNIIEQIVTLYSNNELFITLDGGDAIVGTSPW